MGNLVSLDSICGLNIGKSDGEDMHDQIIENKTRIQRLDSKIEISNQRLEDKINNKFDILSSKIDNVLLIISHRNPSQL
jgi:hypothetical protein